MLFRHISAPPPGAGGEGGQTEKLDIRHYIPEIYTPESELKISWRPGGLGVMWSSLEKIFKLKRKKTLFLADTLREGM